MSPNPAEKKAKRKEQSQANRLVKVADSIELFHDGNEDAFATVPVKGHHETYPIRSSKFKRWLSRSFYRATNQVPNSQAMKDAINTLEGKGIFDGNEIETYVRVARHEGKVYLDLVNDNWQVVEIGLDGWSVINNPPIRFRRPNGMRSLPTPIQGGSIEELRPFVNIANDQEFKLLVAFLLGALRPTGPYFVLQLLGGQGSAKTFLVRIIRMLLDPNKANVRCEPKNVQDLMIAAKHSSILTLDNLSKLPDWLSDALCRLSTGGGFSTRVLYSDDDEMIFDTTRPVVITSIEEVASKPDLLDRSIRLTCPQIPRNKRKTEQEILAAFEDAHPRILGSLLDGVSAALQKIDTFELSEVDRMADPAKWSCAAFPAFGWCRDDFLDAYQGNRVSGHELAIEASSVGPVLISWIESTTSLPWSGTATELLDELEIHAGFQRKDTQPAKRKTKGWPGASHVLSGQLRRLATDLLVQGISIDFDDREKNTRRSKLIKIANISNPAQSADRLSDASNNEVNATGGAPNASNAYFPYLSDTDETDRAAMAI